MTALGRRLVFAIQYWMRFLFNIDMHINPSDFARSMCFFPIAGLFVGALTAAAAWLGYLTSSTFVAAGFALAGQVLLSGAVSINGIANTLDATAYLDPIDKLNSMKKGTVEWRGVVGISIDIMISFAFLSTLLNIAEWPIALIYMAAVYVCPKLCWVVCAWAFNSAQMDGTGFMYIAGARARDVVGALIFTLIILCLILGLVPAVVLILVSVLICLIAAKIISLSLPRGGITIDTLGTVHEIALIISFAFICLLNMLPHLGIYLPDWITAFELVSRLAVK